MVRLDSFRTHAESDGVRFVDLAVADRKLPNLDRLPISLRLVLENLLRHEDGERVTAAEIEAVAARRTGSNESCEIAFHPSRVLMQDYSGMPALIDLAALRDRVVDRGLPASTVNPRVRTDVVIDHSIIAHATRTPDALARNQRREIEENAERFAFLKWTQQAFDNLRVVPPGNGIVHQINLENLAEIVSEVRAGEELWRVPDTLVGTDSHTPMVNGLGVLGWGVGGIEAEAVMLGEPVSMLVPPVVGVRLKGRPPAGVLATDIVLSLTEALRRVGVVGAYLEFFGPGVGALSVADRATIANMTPEFGARISFFPSDDNTLRYMRSTGRSATLLHRIETHLRRIGCWYDPDFVPLTAHVVEFDLDRVGRTVAGPSRPEQRRDLSSLPALFETPPRERTGCLRDGDVVIAAITSCTNTSNPAAMLAAGLLARKARALGLQVPAHIKTSLAPGSRHVAAYLERTGLLADLAALGFHLVGFGCTTCVGNSGDLDPEISREIDAEDLDVVAVLSGNRNFEARIHPRVRSNFLMSPPLVVACALAGTMRTDLARDPIGHDRDGNPVTLADLWPSDSDIEALVLTVSQAGDDADERDVFAGDGDWASLPVAGGGRFEWRPESTYISRPPFFDLPAPDGNEPILRAARPLMILGDDVTTDHISPVGSIAADSPAGRHLSAANLSRSEFNTYGALRGNHTIMMKGTFANPRLKNRLATRSGGYTVASTGEEDRTIHDVAVSYLETGRASVVVAGRNYGSGSARDWAAKGTRLLGIKAVIAESFESIHRSNLVRMGVLPLRVTEENVGLAARLTASHTVDLKATPGDIAPKRMVELTFTSDEGHAFSCDAIVEIDTMIEMAYFRAGGILALIESRIDTATEA